MDFLDFKKHLHHLPKMAGLQTDDGNAIYIRLNNAGEAQKTLKQISEEIPGVNISSPTGDNYTLSQIF